MWSASVLGHVAADRAHGLARGIGRVVESVRRRGFREAHVHHAGLHHRQAVPRVNRHDASQSGEDQQHRVTGRHGAAREAGSRTAGHEWGPVLIERAHDPHHLVAGSRQYHGPRSASVRGQRVAGERLEIGCGGPNPLGAHDGCQVVENPMGNRHRSSIGGGRPRRPRPLRFAAR